MPDIFSASVANDVSNIGSQLPNVFKVVLSSPPQHLTRSPQVRCKSSAAPSSRSTLSIQNLQAPSSAKGGSAYGTSSSRATMPYAQCYEFIGVDIYVLHACAHRRRDGGQAGSSAIRKVDCGGHYRMGVHRWSKGNPRYFPSGRTTPQDELANGAAGHSQGRCW
jgi:hypothetical protein